MTTSKRVLCVIQRHWTLLLRSLLSQNMLPLNRCGNQAAGAAITPGKEPEEHAGCVRSQEEAERARRMRAIPGSGGRASGDPGAKMETHCASYDSVRPGPA